MSLISEILPLSHIELDLEVSSKKRVFEQAGLLLENEAGLARADVFDCLFAREKLGTTGLGQGVAIPHGRHASVKKAVGAFIRTKEPVPFDAPDGKPVSLIFVLLVPENATGEHLEVLSKLAGRFSQKSVREALSVAASPEEVQRLLSEE
ncbi:MULTISPECIES: PTS IIA-like nitrogen regulatory protein PtsN [Neisseria]|uniref:PTS IIA-like nitrogen regulatory protein PtsN n=1 Tax=Neisseria TaxID=482 RepID=UPI00211BAE4F|nr:MULTISPECIES: PTS IIA-like nitrogen regulatory protein PtsN [Neisseria]MCQ9325579.1 PTS IIA-like nitrogen regulatory protein PtsN [Neisseria dentiae]MDO4227128.1 PTS IIA-like nitrogen regulatory protein PtsN [Neisseria sp.]